MSDGSIRQAKIAVLPPGCAAYRRTPEFTEATVPTGLLGRHCTAPGTWALVHVLEGRLLYRVLDPPVERILDASSPPGVVGPGVPHQVIPLGKLRFQVEFYRMKAEADSAPACAKPAGGAIPNRVGECDG